MTVSKAKTFRNIIYTSLTKGTTVICVALTSTVVARNLPPADYGVVGFAAIVIGFLRNFSDLGVGTAAIRRPRLDQDELSTAFILKLVLGGGALVVALLVAPFVHLFFNHPAIGNVIRLLALNFVVSTIGFAALVTLTREQNYRALVIPGVVGAVVRCLLAVVLVTHGWKYWAVVAADVGANLTTATALQVSRRIPISIHFDHKVAREYLHFGLPLFGSGVFIFLIFNLDNFLIGYGMGASQLGYYALAFSWGSFVCGILADTVNNVMLPTLSTIQNDLAAMRRWYLKTVDMVTFAAVAVNTTLLANAHYFLTTFLGKGSQKWAPAALSLQILCVYGIFRAMIEPIGPCLMARGQTRPLLHANMVAGAVEISLLLLALKTGRIELVAAVVLFAYVTQTVVYLPLLRRELGIHPWDIVAQVWPVVPVIVGSYIITSFLPESLGTSIFTLAVRALFTVVTAALIHGICTRFRCFHVAGGMIWQQYNRVRA